MPTQALPLLLGLCSAASAAMVMPGAYRVRLRSPMGIMFEECEAGKPSGVSVGSLVPDGNAERDGRILVGDELVTCSAVILGGDSALVTIGRSSQYTNWKRELIPVSKMDFDAIMAAIGSNSGRYGYTDVVLELRHTDASVPRQAGAERPLRADDGDDVEWDWSGASQDGKGLPLRPKPDDF